MRRFLLRLALFSGLQSLLLGGFLWFTSSGPQTISATDAPHLSSEERIDRFLREYLFAMYRGDDRLLDDFLNSPASIHAAVVKYLAGPNNFMATLIDKDERLKTAPGPRMILLGGSGVAFGMDSQLIAERYAYTPVNYGLHAALGGDFMLKHVGEHVRPGDVVVLCMENGVMYHLFKTTYLREHLRGVTSAFDHYFDLPGQQTKGRLAQWKRYCDSQALSDLAVNMRSRVAWCKEKLRDARSSRDHFDAAFDARRAAMLTSLPQQALDGQYQRSAFNEFGDYQGHLRLADAAKPADPKTWGSDRMEPENLATLHESINRINAFSDECQQKGVQVLFSYPPLIKLGDYEGFAKEYSAVVEARLKLKPLYSIDETYFDTDLFFDSSAHLTWPGIRRRMTILTKALDQHFPVQTTMPVEVHLAERERRIFAEFPQTAARAGNLVR